MIFTLLFEYTSERLHENKFTLKVRSRLLHFIIQHVFFCMRVANAQTLGKFRSIVEKVVALDEIGIFAVPVLESQAFNYFTFVRNPMDFGTLRKNLGDDSDVCKYDTFLDAYEDLQRIFLNCIHYNQEAKVRDGSLGSVAFKLLCTTRELVNEAFP